MTTPPPPDKEPEHSGLRPLSPYGEGYCRWCCFVVGLDYSGMLVPHSRNSSYQARKCDGSDTKAPKVTPYMSRKAMFRVKAQKVTCHLCRREVSLLADGRMASHSADPYRPNVYCKGGYQVPGRDHANERG